MGPRLTAIDPAISSLLEATSTLVSSPELSEVLSKILRLAEMLLDADAYAVWHCRANETTWRILYSAGLSDAYTKQTIAAGVDAYPGDQPVVIEDVNTVPLVSHRTEMYRDEHVSSLIVYPLRTPEGGTGTVTFYFHEPKRMDVSFVQTGQLLANISNAAIHAAELFEAQKSLRQSAQRAAERAEFLASASTLLSSSLDYTTTLNRLAQLAVPKLADWCSVSVLEDSNRLERIAVAHADPAKLELAREYGKKFPAALNQRGGVGEVIRSGKPLLVKEVTEEMLQQAGFPEEQLRLLRRLGMKSVLIVPLISRNVPLGALTMMTAESGRILTAEDLEITQSMATRAAVAIDNARLYEAMAQARAEAQLREEELRLVQESAKVASWSYDLERQLFSFSSPHAGELLGRGTGLYALSFDEFRSVLFFSTDQQKFREGFASLEKGRKEVDLQFRVASGRGSVRLLAMRGKLFFNSGQSRALGVLIDVTTTQNEKVSVRKTKIGKRAARIKNSR